jgi:hypothetical protein
MGLHSNPSAKLIAIPEVIRKTIMAKHKIRNQSRAPGCALQMRRYNMTIETLVMDMIQM